MRIEQIETSALKAREIKLARLQKKSSSLLAQVRRELKKRKRSS